MNILATTDIMSIFDVILIVYGIYTIYSAFMMKRTGVPGKWLITEQEIAKCKDMPGFIDAMYLKTILFGGVALLYGALSTLNRMKLSIPYLDTICIIAFLIVCGIYIVALNKAKKKFF